MTITARTEARMTARDDYPTLRYWVTDATETLTTRTRTEFARALDEIDRLRLQLALVWPACGWRPTVEGTA